MKKWFVVILLAALVVPLVPAQPTQMAEAQSGPMVLAYFYGWFNSGQWSAGELLDRPAEPYDSADAGVMSRQIGQAQSAGIDGFVMSWFGPGEPYTSGVFGTLLNQASSQGFHVAVDIDMGQGFLSTIEEAQGAVDHAIHSLGSHPAYLRYDGKPVIFFWNQQRFTPQQWAGVRSAVDPNHDSIWIAEGNALAYVGVFDGLNLYNIAWSGSPAGTNATWASRVKGAGGIFVATAMPGFDESHLGRADPVVRDRGNGSFFQASFSGAVASSPHMIIITSWNEFFENSHIEPSANFGTQYLDMARDMIGQYKATGSVPAAPAAPADGGEAAPQDSTIPPLVEGQPGAAPTIINLNVRQGPSTDAKVLAVASSPNVYPLIGKNADASWYKINYGGGEGWISAQFANVQGDINAVPVTE